MGKGRGGAVGLKFRTTLGKCFESVIYLKEKVVQHGRSAMKNLTG